MSRARRLIEGALSMLDEASAKADAQAVAKLSPAERERYDAWQERTAAINAGVSPQDLGDGRLVGKVLQGPAGEAMAGVTKAPKQRDAIEDPDAWERQRMAERAARDAIRAQYLSPARRPVRITRVATQRKSQAREVAAFLAARGLSARPDLAYGASRVPDLISPGRLGGEDVVEWDVVHAAEGDLAPASLPAVLSLEARDVLVVRAAGEPAPLDEDLALDILARADVGPERTLAIARDVGISKTGGGIAAAALGIFRLATEAGPSSDRIVAEGTVAALDGPAAAPATFTAGADEQFTVWLRAGGASNVRETVVAGTACDLARPDGTTTRVRGSRQGTSVATDHHETIGDLRAAAGANTLSCRHVAFGPGGRRGRLRDEHAFVVERGTPGDGLRGLWPLFGGILAIAAGVVAFTTSRRPASRLPG